MKEKKYLILGIGFVIFMTIGFLSLRCHNVIYAWSLGDVESLYIKAEQLYQDAQYEEAREMYKKLASIQKAAALNNPVALYNMATFHIEGHGFPKNLEKGAEYLKAAAQLGLPAAQFNLGRMYQLGKGVEQDEQEAERLFRQASAQGHQLATDFLIQMEAKDSTSVNDTIFRMKMIAK